MPYADPAMNKACKTRRYRANPEIFKARQRRARQRTRDHIWQIKMLSKCARCGNADPRVLEFHHRDPAIKDIGPSDMTRDKWSPVRIDKELEKCDVLCANCHRIIHHELRSEFLV